MAQYSKYLPPDMLECVVDELIYMHAACPEKYMSSISTMSMVHRRLHHRLQPVLFSHLILRGPDIENTAIIRASPVLVSFIRHLSVAAVKDWSVIDTILLQGRHSIESMDIDDASNTLQCSTPNQVPGYARSMCWLRQVSIILGSCALPSPDLWNPWRDHMLLNWLIGLHPAAWRSIRRFSIYGAPATHIPLLPQLELAIVGLPGPVQPWDKYLLPRLMAGNPGARRVVFVYNNPGSGRPRDTSGAATDHGLDDDTKRERAQQKPQMEFEDVHVDLEDAAFLLWWQDRTKEGSLWALTGRNWRDHRLRA